MPPLTRYAVSTSPTALSNDSTAPVTSLLYAIHAASTDVDEWPRVLGQLRKRLNASVAALGYHEFTTGSDSTLYTSPAAGSFSQDLAEFGARNPWFLSSDDYAPGRVMTGDELAGMNDIRRTDFYRGFLQPRGWLHMLCGVVEQNARGVHLLHVYRAERQPAFSEQDRSDLRALLDHVMLSLTNQWRWQEANDLSKALLALNDNDAHPAILVTADANVIYSNPAAEQLLDERQGLRLEGARLLADSVVDRRLLSTAIRRIAQSDVEGSTPSPSVLTLAGTAPCPASMVIVLRAAGQVFKREIGRRQALVMVTVRGGQTQHDPATCLLAQQYELTAAQARVCALIFSGQSLPGVSQSLNLSENTVRSHLRQIFQKTGTHGQMELVHLHARTCPTLL